MAKTTKKGTVYIVHHVDTEGPLHEPLEETFKRVENILGIKIKAERTEANLKRLQRGELVGDDKELIKRLLKIVDPALIKLNKNWKEVDQMLQKITSKNFRNEIKDSFGGGWIYNWHIMDHVGFKTNERGRDLGYFKIFNHYEKLIQTKKLSGDGIHWHFHPISFFKEAHVSATSYENSYAELHQIICRRLIEKSWFPRVNRAGFHTERPDSNWFLEQWIPFDPSNQAEVGVETQKEAETGRFSDWRGAPSNWDIYQPDLYDWRKKGEMNRHISRTLNLRARYQNISEIEIEKAFREAQKGKNVYLGVTNHDYRDMAPEIETFRETLNKVSKKFPNTPYKFSEAVEAFRKVLGYSETEVNKEEIDFEVSIKNKILYLKIKNGQPFGPQPYLAIKTKKGEYFHDNLDFGEFKKEYFYTFDRYTIELDVVSSITLASNDKYGNCCIVNITFKNGKPIFKKSFLK